MFAHQNYTTYFNKKVSLSNERCKINNLAGIKSNINFMENCNKISTYFSLLSKKITFGPWA